MFSGSSSGEKCDQVPKIEAYQVVCSRCHTLVTLLENRFTKEQT